MALTAALPLCLVDGVSGELLRLLIDRVARVKIRTAVLDHVQRVDQVRAMVMSLLIRGGDRDIVLDLLGVVGREPGRRPFTIDNFAGMSDRIVEYCLDFFNRLLLLKVGLAKSFQNALFLFLETSGLVVPLTDPDNLLLDHFILVLAHLGPFLGDYLLSFLFDLFLGCPDLLSLFLELLQIFGFLLFLGLCQFEAFFLYRQSLLLPQNAQLLP